MRGNKKSTWKGLEGRKRRVKLKRLCIDCFGLLFIVYILRQGFMGLRTNLD